MNINRWGAIVISIVLSACAGQNPPAISTLEESVPVATPSSPSLPLFFTTPQTSQEPTPIFEGFIPITGETPTPISTLDIYSLIGAPTPTNATDTSTDFIPITGQESIPSNDDVKPDKPQEFIIPIKGGGEGNPGLGLSGLIPVTGYPPGVITGVNIPSSKNLITPMLVIPSLKVNIPIYGIKYSNGTWDVSWLLDQAGWLEGTAYPTRNGNSVLTAHVVTADGKNGPFAHLKTLTVDDYVFIYNSGFRYIYKVDSTKFVKPDDMSVFSHEDESWLTLITCDSYDEETRTYLLRVVVRAQLVEVQEVK